MKRQIPKLILLAFIILGVEFFVGWGNLLDLLVDFVKQHSNPYAFLAVMGVGCALPLSLSFCYLFAGAAFPFWQAWILCLLGLTISSMLGYFIGRFFVSKEKIEYLSSKFRLGDTNGESYAKINFFVRAIPGIPYFLQNIILGGIRSSFGLYLLINLLVQGGLAMAMIRLGASAVADVSNLERALVIGILICVLVIIHFLIRCYYKKLRK